MELMEKYFDAFIYVSNWGHRWFMLKVPQRLINFDLAKQYCFGENTTAYQKSDSLIFEFNSGTEDYDWEEGEGWLSSLISLRADILGGDYRCLYLGWLYCVQAGDFDEDELEPPVPPNLDNLNDPLQNFVSFMRINPDLIAVAAQKSAFKKTGKDFDQISAWIQKLPEKEKDEILLRMLKGNDPHKGKALMQRFEQIVLDKTEAAMGEKTRSVGELLEKAEKYTAERKRQATKKRAAKQAQKKREEAIAREKYLDNLVKSENQVWEKTDSLVNAGKQAGYDEAVKLLVDLHDLGIKTKKMKQFKKKLENISTKYRRKTSFIKRLKDAGIDC